MTGIPEGDRSGRPLAECEASRGVSPRLRRFARIMRLRGGLPVAVAVVALLSASCIRVDVGIQVNDDGSGTVSFVTAIDSSAAGSLAKSLGGTESSSGAGPDFTNLDKSTLPEGSTVEPYKDGKYEGARVTTPFRTGDDIAAIVNEVSSSTSSAETGAGSDTGTNSPLFEQFALTREADGWSFKATINPASGVTAGANDLVSPEQLKVLFKDASFTVRVKLPGSVVSHDADSVGKNGELIWKLDIFATKARTLSARTGPSTGGGFPVLPVAAGAAGVLVLAGVAGFVARRRRGIAAGSIGEAQAGGSGLKPPPPDGEPPEA